jgi:predicted dehydrogenase
MTAAAPRAGKSVYVEKPLALSAAEAIMLRETVRATGNDGLKVGFNRRFSPLVQEMRAAAGAGTAPWTVHCRVHAGQLEAGS